MMSLNTGIIVDGIGDYNSLKTRFTSNCRILKTDGPRGHTASIEAIVANSAKQIAMLLTCGCSRVIVMIDYEERSGDYGIFTSKLESELTRVYGKNIYLSVPNRMIENWYLSDICKVSQEKAFIKNKLKQKNYEGLNGKEELKKCFVKGKSYSETAHGPQIFKIIRFEISRLNSSSFNKFLVLFDDANK